MSLDSIVSGILSPIFSIIDKAVPDKTKSLELKTEIEKTVLENKAEMQKTMRDIAIAEVSGNWFQSSWRPLFSYIVIFLLLWVYFLEGLVEAISGVSIVSANSQDIATLAGIWGSIYGIGRSFEKSGSRIKIGSE